MNENERDFAIAMVEDHIARDPDGLYWLMNWTVERIGGGVYTRWAFTSPDRPEARAIVETDPHRARNIAFEGIGDGGPDDDYVAALFAPKEEAAEAPSSAPAGPDPSNPWDHRNYADGQILGEYAAPGDIPVPGNT